jgi:hypothetical protein
MQSNIQWHVETADQITQTVCERILELAKEAIAEHGQNLFWLAAQRQKKCIGCWQKAMLSGQNGSFITVTSVVYLLTTRIEIA